MRLKSVLSPQVWATALLALLFAAACSGSDDHTETGGPDFSEVPEFVFDEALRISEFESDDAMFFASVGMALASPDGDIIVADWRANALHNFGPDGTYRGQVGRAGAGPGEFESIGPIAMSTDGRLHVTDRRQMRIVGFTADGNNGWTHDQTHNINSPERGQFNGIEEFFYLSGLHPTDAGYIAEFYSSISYEGGDTVWSCFVHMSNEFSINQSDDAMCFEATQPLISRSSSGGTISVTMMSVPETHRTHFAVTPEGGIVRLHTSEPRITIQGLDETLISEFSFPAARVPITSQKKQQLAQRTIPNPQESSFRISELTDVMPEYKGYATQLTTDTSGRIWVLARTAEDETGGDDDVLTWLIYNPDGELLAHAVHPGGNFSFISEYRAFAVFNPSDDDPAFAVFEFEL